MKIYTKTGDKGETSLFNGTRVKKTNKRIIAYGTIDEVNSNLGILIHYSKKVGKFEDITQKLLEIQRDLFILGSDLANPDLNIKNYPRINNEKINNLEKSIDLFDTELDKLTSFILPGGSLESSHCHIIRTIIRRSEIYITELFLNNEINQLCLIYVNRLSDFFFIVSRVFNKRQNIGDVVWKAE